MRHSELNTAQKAAAEAILTSRDAIVGLQGYADAGKTSALNAVREAHYEVGDVLHYQRGSRSLDIEKQSYATVVATQPKENLLTVETDDGKQVTYNPSRLLRNQRLS